MADINTDGSPREAVIAAIAGAAIVSWITRRIGAPTGARRLLAGVAAANGLISGHRGIYDWNEPEGVAAFVLDSTWSISNTAASLAVHAVQPLHDDPDYRPELSRRRNRHVYGGGFAVRKGFVFAQGNVISSAGRDIDFDADTPPSLRRRLLIERHENLHVWQARWFGPFYAPIYVGWMVFGAVRGFLRWRMRPDHSLGEHIEVAAYYENPMERWAYAADDNWPTRTVRRLRA
ncbi:MAG TPA: hypothetical protein VMW08_10170 [Acidimicrobiales bacterium]|nr:hypothetical protein [Acidimicrobiales bacterium]